MRSRERWAAVVGFPDYEVSDRGQVRSYRRSGSPRLLTPSWHRTRSGTAYYRVTLYGHRRAIRDIHTLVLEAFVGPCPKGMEGCHGPSGSLDNALTNLRWDTRRANVLDRVRDGHDRNARKDVCPLDHRLEQPNLVAARLPGRVCLACNRGTSARRRARLRGEVVPLRILADRQYAMIMKDAA
jgi:NUMOD4 motif-containing protein